MDSNKYCEAHDLQRRDASEVIEEFSDELAMMHGRCIDIGCGPGNITKELILPKLPNDSVVVGTDISTTMIERAMKKYNNDERLTFSQLDIETRELSIDEIGKYDHAVSFYCLHWCQNMRHALGNIYKLLRPGGQALVMFLSYNDGFDAYKRLQSNPRYKPYMEDASRYIPPYQYCLNPRATMKKTLEEVGFEVLHCSNREKTFVYDSMDILQKHILAVNPFLKRIPDNLQDEYKDVVTREVTCNKIFFENKRSLSNGYSILDRYGLLIAHFRKPIVTFKSIKKNMTIIV